MRLEGGEIVAVVGPNGAGKSTLVNVIAGLHRARSGQIVVDGTEITTLPSHRYCDQGIAIVPEGRRLFPRMTVRENLELGAYRRSARERSEAPRAAIAWRPLSSSAERTIRFTSAAAGG